MHKDIARRCSVTASPKSTYDVFNRCERPFKGEPRYTAKNILIIFLRRKKEKRLVSSTCEWETAKY